MKYTRLKFGFPFPSLSVVKEVEKAFLDASVDILRFGLKLGTSMVQRINFFDRFFVGLINFGEILACDLEDCLKLITLKTFV